jgi:hypothetical protein
MIFALSNARHFCLVDFKSEWRYTLAEDLDGNVNHVNVGNYFVFLGDNEKKIAWLIHLFSIPKG